MTNTENKNNNKTIVKEINFSLENIDLIKKAMKEKAKSPSTKIKLTIK